MTTLPPDVTVIMAVDQQRKRGSLALGALLRQTIIDRMEILLFDCSAPDTPPLEGSEHAAVQVIPMQQPVTLSALFACGIRMARGSVVMMTEEHCVTMPTWAENLFNTLQGDWAVAGGRVMMGNKGLGTGDMSGMVGFIDWLPPVQGGESLFVDGHNGAYKREILLRYDAELEQMLENEIAMQKRLRQDGYRVFLEPSAEYFHMNETTLDSLCRGYYHWNRCLGATQKNLLGWSPIVTALMTLRLPFQPWLRTARLGMKIITKRRQYLGTFLRFLPSIVIALHSAAWGQAQGLLIGEGSASKDFSYFSLNEHREMPNWTLDQWLAAY